MHNHWSCPAIAISCLAWVNIYFSKDPRGNPGSAAQRQETERRGKKQRRHNRPHNARRGKRNDQANKQPDKHASANTHKGQTTHTQAQTEATEDGRKDRHTQDKRPDKHTSANTTRADNPHTGPNHKQARTDPRRTKKGEDRDEEGKGTN